MALFCRLGWHRWTDSGGRVLCPRCRTAAVAPRPRLVRIASWTLVVIAVVSVVRALAAVIVAPHVDEAEAQFAALVGEVETAVYETRDVLGYSIVAGVLLAAVLVPVLLALRGPLSGARWAAVGVLSASLMGQILFIASDLSEAPLRWGIVPGWYPLTQQLIELVLILASAAVIVLLLHGTSREYFEEGVADADEDDVMERALAAARARRAAER
ncbi:hypothetical protein Ais01nite_57840 [Asanoa ishikariensis]|uniref:Uncharacterized protein n=1 Tax=Asanoa ishikariensis TaxID=137265 RepID=A0A1H3U0I1_9ACTN|nr:hypothetical protein [Asanoa ishikariensis]GIF67749.1 hypothetical protein Ais01nite_57840 [Asanoa ishikariensis]SDZ55561.1 hypothetical protein SAMN05421684_6646 [Asanoa ishikariensis]